MHISVSQKHSFGVTHCMSAPYGIQQETTYNTAKIQHCGLRIFAICYGAMSQSQVTDILRECEKRLRVLLQEAARKGDYECLLEATKWARELSALVEAASPHSDPASIPEDTSGAAAVPRRVTVAPEPLPPPTRMHARRKRKGRLTSYPKFGKQGNQLVKTGWSKKEKREYQHRAPKRVAELLRDALIEVGGAGRLLSTDDLFPLAEDDGTDVPTYQSYLCLAWFRQANLIAQKGRQGYSVPDPAGLPDRLAHAWDALSTV